MLSTPRNVLAFALLFIAVGCVLAQLWNTKERVQLSQELEQSPIEFSSWTPEKAEYQPGDLIHFTFTRTTKEQKEPLLLISVDFFENADTGEIFRAASVPKKIREWGSESVVAARRIPNECPPGRYTLEGLASAQTTRLTRTVGYSSEAFTIVAKPK
jgi:hypothetical protein